MQPETEKNVKPEEEKKTILKDNFKC